MKAVLINDGQVRLGWTRVSHDTRVVEFGGGVFAWTGDTVVLDDSDENGIAFEQTIVEVVRDLDYFNPTRGGKRP